MSELPSNAPGRDDPGRDDPAGYAHMPTRIVDPAPGPASGEPDYQEQWADEYGQLPPRPRRRLATPLNAALLAVLLIACGFVGGVLVEKGQGGGSSAASARGGRAFAAGGAAAGAGRGTGAPTAGSAAAGVTAGTVSNVSGHTIYVTDTQGDTVAVKAASGAKVSRASSAAVSQIHPGDTVIVQGARNANGTLTATSIRATAPSAAAGGGLAALFGGGFGGRTGGGAAAGGAAGSGAGGGGAAGAGAGGGSTGGGGSGGQPLFGKG
jgi:hypothetical protein